MKLDRALIKTQARDIIKGKVFVLFVLLLVVGILTTGGTFFSSFSNGFNSGLQAGGYSDVSSGVTATVGLFGGFGSIIGLICAPLEITLCALFVQLVNGADNDLGTSFTYLFKTTFDGNYIQRLLLQFLKGIFILLWTLLFIIPGCVYYYKVYFASFIMSQNPNMQWKEAIALSKKMTNGHKGELFAFDLSFIPWYLLMAVTAGIAGIYVAPYVMTARALYFENFKQRGFQSGELNESDFISAAEKAAAFNPNGVQYDTNMYQPPVQQPQANAFNPTYQAPQPPVQPQYQPPVQPQEPVAPAPQESYYQPPQEEAPAFNPEEGNIE